ncbi:hypothetical protein MLD38_009690 [Melastoma candidum]|uniref:Uncharacterized protein n=1 Tax=Melastoma candidum TaxID=119954 RepID=A0ACB9S1E5_9MYRT|nr:hypothetical protein MLD38_009690 [Melastoma candidum]
MLQWMGGSRRKITTSRKSVQKRQKQYFELRKRRLWQQQQPHSPGSTPCFSLKNDESRSLDILCMLDDSSAPLTGEKDEHSNINASSVCGSAATHVSADTTTEAGSPLKCQVDAVCQEKEGADFHARKENPNTGHVKCPSLLDLLGDHPIDGSAEIKPIKEEHVAFSVEGLGTVEVATPSQSPLANNRMNDFGVPRGKSALEFNAEGLEFDDVPCQDLSFSVGHVTFKKKKSFVDNLSYGCLKNECYSLPDHPSHEVCFKRRGINTGGTRGNTKVSPRYNDDKLELTSWKTLVDDGLDSFSLKSCESEESCTSSAAWEKGVGNAPLDKSSKQVHSRGSSAYTSRGLGPKILPDNVEEDGNLDSKLWIHEPLDESFATPFVTKPRRDRFWDGFTQLSGRRDSRDRLHAMEFRGLWSKAERNFDGMNCD